MTLLVITAESEMRAVKVSGWTEPATISDGTTPTTSMVWLIVADADVLAEVAFDIVAIWPTSIVDVDFVGVDVGTDGPSILCAAVCGAAGDGVDAA